MNNQRLLCDFGWSPAQMTSAKFQEEEISRSEGVGSHPATIGINHESAAFSVCFKFSSNSGTVGYCRSLKSEAQLRMLCVVSPECTEFNWKPSLVQLVLISTEHFLTFLFVDETVPLTYDLAKSDCQCEFIIRK